MKGIKRYLCLALALVMALCVFTGCGDKTNDPNNPNSSNTNDPNNTAAPTGFVYVPEYVTVQGEFTSGFGRSSYSNGYIYTTSYEKIADNTPDGVIPEYEGEYWEFGTVIYKIGMDGSCEKINFTPPAIPDGAEGSASVDNMYVSDNGNITMLERLYTYTVNVPEGVEVEEYSDDYWNYYESKESYSLRTIGSDGSDVSTFPLEGLGEGEEYFYVNSFTMDKDGNIYIASDEALYVLNGEGELLCKITSDSGWIQSVMQLADGRMVCSRYGENGPELTVIDLEAKGFGESIETKMDLYSMTPGGGDYDFYYTSGVNFFGYNLETGESEKILNWINCDVNNENSNSTIVLDDGRIVSMNTEWDSNYENCTNELIVLSKQPASSVPQKTIITLATQYLNWDVRGAIIDFNRNNGEYRIEVRDYSEYNTDDDYTAGQTKLTTEILSGQMPDILDMSGMPFERLASKGLLEDLYTYIDNDPNLSREDLIPSALAAYEDDGKLYQTLSSFYVQAVMGSEKVVGDKPGWTYDEFNAALASMPEGCTAFDQYITRDDMLATCMALDGDSYVDWSTGECSFDSEAFVKMLEFVKSFPSTFDWENYNYNESDSTDARIASGRQMLLSSGVSNFNDFLMYDAMFGGTATYIGYPTENGTGNMLYAAGANYAMSSKCANKDGAWQFLRQFFTEEYQEKNGYGGFPTNKAAFDKRLEEAMTPEYQKDADGNFVLDENGNKIEVSNGGWSWGGVEVEMRAINQAEADRILELINTTTKAYKSDESILEIVKEEVAPFFEGQKSAEDVAKLIQSKATLYVNEQR